MGRWQIEKQTPAEVIELIVEAGTSANSKKIVCFDYFDTLAVRCVYPEYTKILASSLLAMVLGEGLSGTQLYAMRQKMEKTLCKRNVSRGGDLDFNLEELSVQLYDAIAKKMPDLQNSFSQKQFTGLLLSMETAVECAVQQPCQPALELLRAVKKRGLETVLISDFYLPKPYFIKMLMPHGLKELFDHIYISADYGATKGSGRLYRMIMDELGRRPEQMIMIGDNPHADVKMAAEMGIEAIFIENATQKDVYRRQQASFRNGKQSGKHLFSLRPNKNVCFPEMGTTLWLFACRLFRSLIRSGARHVFFFSKEGELLKRLFDDFQQTLFGTAIINTHYMIVSRKATYVASLNTLERETFSRLFDHYRDISLRDFMLSLNMEASLAEKICGMLDLDFETRHQDLASNPALKRLLRSDAFKQTYETLRQEQKNGFMGYLDSFGVDYTNEGLFIVDVGWKGSIQDNLYHILGGKVAIQGFYAGSLIATQLAQNNRKAGVLFSDRPQPSSYFNVYNNNRSLFEMLLGASHGSADGYFRPQQGAGLAKIRKQQEYTRAKSRSGEVCVMVLDLPEERALFERMIQPLQQSILETAATCTRQFLLAACRRPEDVWFARRHARMVFRPAGKEVDLFEKLYHLENFGIFEYTTFGRDARTTWEQRWANFKGVLLHPKVLETGIWPPIILRRMGVGLLRHYDGWRRTLGQFGLRW